MVALLRWPIVKWSSLLVTRSWRILRRKTWLSWSLGIPLGTFREHHAPICLRPSRFRLTYCRATTHADIVLRARELGIKIEIIHNASIMSAVGATGLQLYNFGQTVSMVFFTETWKPSSFYDRIKENRQIGLHTLLLLDIKVKEQSVENLARGRKIYEPPRFMTVAECAFQMLEIEDSRGEGVYQPRSLAIGVARIGSKDQTIVTGTLEQLSTADLGQPLHSLVLLGRRTHDLERAFIREFAVNTEVFDAVWTEDYAGKQ